MTFIEGDTFDAMRSNRSRAEAAGVLVGRWHAAVDDLQHEFVGVRLGVHDTAAHIVRLRQALEERRDHRLHEAVSRLTEPLLDKADTVLSMLPPSPERVCHGDLKLSNIIFRGSGATCLIDLDTVGPMQLAYELGDAWRSWCNPNTEDALEAQFDMDVFEASWRGYASTINTPMPAEVRRGLVVGLEVISLELSARFAADALCESYFGWDDARYPAAGEHNLARARGQWSLHVATRRNREARAAIIGA
jgi:aminoglycoside phosphotransferase (APT) family kinase protein